MRIRWIGFLLLAACSQGEMQSPTPPSPDPRIGLKAGPIDAGIALWNLDLISATPAPEKFAGITNSDLAFKDHYVIQGNYNGFQIWDISNPAKPALVTAMVCPASQSDVSVYGNLLFVSGEGLSGRTDCGTEGVPEPVNPIRLRGIRIFDISDIRNPKYIANVQTCRGSHTHTVVTDAKDPAHVYVYISGSAGVRPAAELPGCSALAPDQDPNSALFRIEVIKVPLANPQAAAIITSPRIFEGLGPVATHSETPADTAGRGARRAARQGAQPSAAPPRGRTGPTQCHDITVYPAVGLAGGACGGYGLLLDISDVANPRRLAAAADTNFAFWHSATFSNDGTKILFTDEWGGGGAPRCRATDRYEWGADAIFTIENRRDLKFHSYFKMPAAQTSQENCVAHNGSLIPIPGREVMVQGWYQGGINVFDWTNPAKPVEIAFFDRGPVDATRMGNAGSWSAYWYNGLIVSSEIGRGLDILELKPSAWLSRNEIDAAKTVRFREFNAQEQQKFVWPASFALARAYVDQLERSRALSSDRIRAIRRELERAEKSSSRGSILNGLAEELSRGASSDAAKVTLLVSVLRDLALS